MTDNVVTSPLSDILIPPDIADKVHLNRSAPPAFYYSANDRQNVAIQALVRQLSDTANISARPLPLDEIHALNKGIGTSNILNLTRPQIQVVDLFREAVKRKASDIHLRVGEDGVTIVKFRIHGELFKMEHLTMSKEDGENLASTIILSMCDVTEAQFNSNRPQDGRIKQAYLAGLNLYSARYAHTPTVDGIVAVMRLVNDDSGNPPGLDELGFLPEQQTLLRKILAYPEGVVILSGPTGSGKSTTLRTLSSMYLAMHNYQRNLVTYEDPPEGHIVGAIQCPIIADKNNPDDVLRAWRLYLSNTLRIDPDAILVGEMRDAFSAQACITNGMTGHIVLATQHANDPINILERMLTMDVRPELLSDPQLFIGLASQRLVQTLCPHCAQQWEQVACELEPDLRALLEKECDTDQLRFRHREGCPECDNGVNGRSVVAEIIHPDARFMKIYRTEGKLAARAYWTHHLSGISRNAHVMKLIQAGRVDPRSASSVCPLDEDRRLSEEVA